MQKDSFPVYVYNPHVYANYAAHLARGRYGVVMLFLPDIELCRYLSYSHLHFETVADYWAVVDDFGNLVRVEDRMIR